MKKGHLAGAFAVLAAVTCTASAQQPVPVRDLGPVVAKATEPIAYFFGLRSLSDGRVLVNDGLGRRLMLLDSALALVRVVADSGNAGAFTFSRPLIPIIPFTGDSVLFIDYASQSLLVAGPLDTRARAMAPPKVSDLGYLRSSFASADVRGRLLYRGYRPPLRVPGAAAPVPSDSAPIIRADLDARTIDTLAMVKMPANPPYQQVRGADGKVSFKEVFTALAPVDEWALLADGTVAIVRGHDYHIDWVSPDGARSSSTKLPFDWKRLTDDDKQRLVDSMRAELEKLDLGGRGGMTLPEVAGRIPEQQLRIVTNADGTKTVPVAIEFVPLTEITDYYPPIRPGAVKADLDSNLWILPTTSARSRKGGLVYDVVNRRGELFERIEIPAGRVLAGFGRGGTVYLVSGDRAHGYGLEAAAYR